MRVDALAIGSPPFHINVIVEAPIGSEPIKFKLDNIWNALRRPDALYRSALYWHRWGDEAKARPAIARARSEACSSQSL